MEELVGRRVVGRHGRGAVRSSNVVATVSEIARVFVIRLEDTSDDSAWMEIAVEAEACEPATQ